MKSPKKLLAFPILFSVLTSACAQEVTDESENKTTTSLSELSEVTNESTGATLFIRVYEPSGGGEDLPVLILVPGGSGDSKDFVKKQKSAQGLADEGFIVVTFDPDGRGFSEGEEDYDGFDQQDGLKAVIEAVDAGGAEQIGLVTFSYGITMGSGVLARYPDLPVAFLIDWEGPANRDDTGGCDDEGLGHLTEVATCDDEAFWAEREASVFMYDVTVPYLRIQSQKDHVQPDAVHAWLLLNAAVNGKSPWVRVNNGEVNAAYETWLDVPLLDEVVEKNLMTWIAEEATSLFEQD